jgi:ribosome biogenesis GTPase A
MTRSKKRGLLKGHMARAQKVLQRTLKVVDVVLQVVDARAPETSQHPSLASTVGSKPMVLVLNKVDLADPDVSSLWLQQFANADRLAVPLNAQAGEGTDELMELCRQLRQHTGEAKQPLRLVAVGLPNVGKSSLLNRLAGVRRAHTGRAPGVTRGEQWIKVSSALHVLDLPGILMPTLEDRDTAWRLLVMGIVDSSDVPIEEAAFEFVRYLIDTYPHLLECRYGVEVPSSAETCKDDPKTVERSAVLEVMERIAKRRGCLAGGGTVDWHRTGQLIIEEARSGVLGRFSLEKP